MTFLWPSGPQLYLFSVPSSSCLQSQPLHHLLPGSLFRVPRLPDRRVASTGRFLPASQQQWVHPWEVALKEKKALPSLPLDNSVSMTTPYLSTTLFFFFFFSPASVHTTLKSAHSSLTAERDRLKHTIDLQGPQPAQVVGLKGGFSSVSSRAHQKVMWLHGRPLSTIRHCVFDQESPGTPQSLVHQISNESKTSIPESISEFFDAQEYLLSSSSSENEVSHDQPRRSFSVVEVGHCYTLLPVTYRNHKRNLSRLNLFQRKFPVPNITNIW